MAKRFELHLLGMDTPEGFIDADRLIEIVTSLQEMSTRLGRMELDAARMGRPSKHVDRVASLRISLATGSTTIIAERDLGPATLGIDLPDEEAVDRRFSELIDSIGADLRPEWVTDSLASTASDLVSALQRTAPTVEFTVSGVSRRVFETGHIHRETWKGSAPTRSDAEITFTGRLFYVDLSTHRLQVEDDAGNRVSLPNVRNDLEVGKFVGAYVTVLGTPEVDATGRLSRIAGASVALSPDPLGSQRVHPSVPLDDILGSAPGPRPGGIADLTDAEVDAFLRAIS